MLKTMIRYASFCFQPGNYWARAKKWGDFVYQLVTFSVIVSNYKNAHELQLFSVKAKVKNLNKEKLIESKK